MPGRLLRYIAAALGVALVVAVAATAAPRDLDHSFGGDGVVLTPVGTASSAANAIARQADGRLVVVGSAQSPFDSGVDDGAGIVRYRRDGTLDPTFGGGDGIVLDHFGFDGSSANAVAIQPDGKIVVAGERSFAIGSVYVARYLPNGARDVGFGDAGERELSLGSDSASVGAVALQTGGEILVAGSAADGGSGNFDNTSEAFVARFTTEGDVDSGYGESGISRPPLSDHPLPYSQAYDVVVQGDGKAVVAGTASTGSGQDRPTGLGLARLDDHGDPDPTFGSGGVVYDRPREEGGWSASAIALWQGKLVVAGSNRFGDAPPFGSNYVLARYLADGTVDTTFNADGPLPGHVVTRVGSDDVSDASDLAVAPSTGSIAVTGTARDDGVRKLLLVRYTSEGARDDATWRSSNGNFGPRLVTAGNGSATFGTAVLLDALGRIVVSGIATDGDRAKFLVARFGDAPPKRNLRPAARIRGHHFVPRKQWVRFHGLRSFDTDGRIVEYAWRTGDRPFRSLGPVFWHRFGRRGLHVLQLRVRDDRGATAVATFRVHVRPGTRSG